LHRDRLCFELLPIDSINEPKECLAAVFIVFIHARILSLEKVLQRGDLIHFGFCLLRLRHRLRKELKNWDASAAEVTD